MDEIDLLIRELSKPFFIYRMCSPIVDDPGNYSGRIVRGSEKKMQNARDDIASVLDAYSRGEMVEYAAERQRQRDREMNEKLEGARNRAKKSEG